MNRTTVTVAFFGTSIMEHFDAWASALTQPYDLPAIGEPVAIEERRKRGWVHNLFLSLQVGHPDIRFAFDNHGLGGATTRDVLEVVQAAVRSTPAPDVAVLGVGINDVWRCFQGRPELAVHADEYATNYETLLATLTGWARHTICVTETPFGWDETLDVAAMNRQLADYNATAARIGHRRGVPVIDLWQPMLDAAARLPAGLSPWSDGAHLSELGDTLVSRLVHDELAGVLARGMSEERPAMAATHRSARAILLDENNRLILIKRTKDGSEPYWTSPGGTVEPTDASLEQALARELLEELGAVAAPPRQVFLISGHAGDGRNSVQHIFVCRLLSLDPDLRSGPEFTEPGRGRYEIDRLTIDAGRPISVDLRPVELKKFIEDNWSALSDESV